jgi:hypothetical protein
MVYKDDTLYVDILNNDEINNILHLKRQIFSVLNQYEVGNVIINLRGNNYNKTLMNHLICDYHKNYKGNFIIDIK